MTATHPDHERSTDGRPDPTSDHRSTRRLSASSRPRLALGRVGEELGAQRVELHVHRDRRVQLRGVWVQGADPPAEPSIEPLPVHAEGLAEAWFPWSLGNIRSDHHMLVPDARGLPLRPDAPGTVDDLGMRSVLLLPVRDGLDLVASVCVYWSHRRRGFELTSLEHASVLAHEAVSATDTARSEPRPRLPRADR